MTGRSVLCGVALSLVLVGAPAHAQKTKAQLNTEVGTTFPDQMIGAITPSGVRTFQNDLINSIMPTAPVVSGNLACFDGITGLLKDCTFAPNVLIVGSTAISLGTSKGVLYSNGSALGNTNSASGAVLATDASANPSLTSSPTLGVIGATAGSLAFANTTSGTVTLQSASGALGSAVASLPAGTYNVVGDSLDQAFSGKTRFTGTTAPASAAGNTVALGTLASPPTLLNNGQAFVYNTTSGGAILQGAGSIYDVILMNKTSGVVAAAVPTGTQTLQFPGLSSGTCSSGLSIDSSNNLVKIGCPPSYGTGVTTALGNSLSAAGGLTSTIASGTAALGTSAIASAACATVVTVAATNVATTDVVMASFNGDPTAVTGYVPSTNGMLTIFSYPTAGNVNFKVCNNTFASVTPGAITLNWRVVR